MLEASQRRPLRLGGDPSLTAQPPGPAPGILTMHPGCTPRPRDRRTYDAACAAADGEPVHELDACQVGPRTRIWHLRRFATVTQAEQKRVSDIAGHAFSGEAARQHVFVVLRLDDDDTTGWLLAELTAPVYALAPTSDACHAPDVGASAQESTGAGAH